MIRILDEQYQKKMRGGALVLDCAAVITLAVSVRDDLAATPMVRCDVAYGTQNAAGGFDPWDYNNSLTTAPVFIEGRERFGNCVRAAHSCGTAECGADLIAELLTWLETRLVRDGQFGLRAEVVPKAPKVIEDVRTRMRERGAGPPVSGGSELLAATEVELPVENAAAKTV